MKLGIPGCDEGSKGREYLRWGELGGARVWVMELELPHRFRMRARFFKTHQRDFSQVRGTRKRAKFSKWPWSWSWSCRTGSESQIPKKHIRITLYSQFLLKTLKKFRFEPREIHQIPHTNTGWYGPFSSALSFKFGPWYAMATTHRDWPVALSSSLPINISSLGYFIGLLRSLGGIWPGYGPRTEKMENGASGVQKTFPNSYLVVLSWDMTFHGMRTNQNTIMVVQEGQGGIRTRRLVGCGLPS